jgi:hypothetical protein
LPYRIFAGALVVPITICAIFGNILVIYVIKRYHSLRITGNVFLASLAVADVGVSTLAMTFYGLQLLQGRWMFGAVSRSTCCVHMLRMCRSNNETGHRVDQCFPSVFSSSCVACGFLVMSFFLLHRSFI